MLVDITWLVLGTLWLVEYYVDCPIGNPKEAMLGECNLITRAGRWCDQQWFPNIGSSTVESRHFINHCHYQAAISNTVCHLCSWQLATTATRLCHCHLVSQPNALVSVNRCEFQLRLWIMKSSLKSIIKQTRVTTIVVWRVVGASG